MLITFRAVIEVLGKPQQHVEKAMRDLLQQLRQDQQYKVLRQGLGAVKKREEAELWTTFAELEIKTDRLEAMASFCFEYMPSIIEILEPKELAVSEGELSQFLNDLQAKLHQVDMVAKQLRMESDIWRRNLGALLRNYVIVLLKQGNLDANMLSRLTGVDKDKLEDFLDQLIDEGRIDLKEGIYFLKKKEDRKEEKNDAE